MSLTRVRSFSCNTSKPRKPADCKDDNQQKSQSRHEPESERKICGEKTLRKGTCGRNNASSRDDTCGKRRRNNLKTCSDRRADLQKEKKCSAGEARCCSGKNTDRNCNVKERCSTRDSTSSQDTDTRHCKGNTKRHKNSYHRYVTFRVYRVTLITILPILQPRAFYAIVERFESTYSKFLDMRIISLRYFQLLLFHILYIISISVVLPIFPPIPFLTVRFYL